LRIADAAKNNTLKSLFLIVAIKLLQAHKDHQKKICPTNRLFNSIKEHEQIFEYILSQKTALAATAMENHLKI